MQRPIRHRSPAPLSYYDCMSTICCEYQTAAANTLGRLSKPGSERGESEVALLVLWLTRHTWSMDVLMQEIELSHLENRRGLTRKDESGQNPAFKQDARKSAAVIRTLNGPHAGTSNGKGGGEGKSHDMITHVVSGFWLGPSSDTGRSKYPSKNGPAWPSMTQHDPAWHRISARELLSEVASHLRRHQEQKRKTLLHHAACKKQ